MLSMSSFTKENQTYCCRNTDCCYFSNKKKETKKRRNGAKCVKSWTRHGLSLTFWFFSCAPTSLANPPIKAISLTDGLR